MARDKTRMKKKERKNIAAGVAHVNSSFNNTKILISDVQGNAIAWSSDVNPYQSGVNRGGERIVRGSDGSAYYTNDHYRTFTRIE
jgi:hypothetical protein